ncbi:hypothetical protein Trydic_g13859 [Trypoxylus dichotomus]
MKVPHGHGTNINNVSHPWIATVCVVLGIGIFAVAAFWIKKCKSNSPKHEYSALRVDSGSEKNKYEKEVRDGVFASCSQYLANSNRYELRTHLGNIGSRADKHWFVVQDKNLGAERLLTLVPLPTVCPIQPSTLTRDTVLSLFRSLQHPYIHPVLDIEFWDTGAALVSPLNPSGSLRDIIYGCTWHEEYDRKYTTKGEGLPLRQVQCLGRQILEALLFLRNRHFPPFHHLHSGNIIIQNGVARLAGLENPLFGLAPKPPSAPETLAFGYLLYEMTVGYELPAPPSAAHLELELERAPRVASVLSLIFQGSRLPTIEEILCCDLFRGVELRELRGASGAQSFTTPSDVLELLDIVKYAAVPSPIRRSDVVLVMERRKLEDIIEEDDGFEECESVTIEMNNMR